MLSMKLIQIRIQKIKNKNYIKKILIGKQQKPKKNVFVSNGNFKIENEKKHWRLTVQATENFNIFYNIIGKTLADTISSIGRNPNMKRILKSRFLMPINEKIFTTKLAL